MIDVIREIVVTVKTESDKIQNEAENHGMIEGRICPSAEYSPNMIWQHLHQTLRIAKQNSASRPWLGPSEEAS